MASGIGAIAPGRIHDAQEEPEEVKEQEDAEIPHEESPAEKRLRLAREYLARTGGTQSERGEAADDALASSARGVHRCAAGVCGGTAALPQTLSGHRLPATALALSHDCANVFSVGKDGRALLHPLGNADKAHEKLVPRRQSASQGGKKRKRACEIENTRKYLSAAASDDGRMFAAGDDGGCVTVWDVRERRPVTELTGHKGAVTGVAFRSQSQALLSCSEDRTIRVWSCDSLVHIDTLFGHQSGAVAVDALASDRAASAGRDRTVRAWRVESDKQLILRSSAACPESACFIGPKSGSHILTGNEDGSVSLWSTSRRKPVQVRPYAHAPNHGVALETTTSRCKPLGKHAMLEGKRARRAVESPSRNGDGAAAMAWVSAAAGDTGTDIAATGAGDGAIRLWRWYGSQLACVGAAPARGFVNDIDISGHSGLLVAASGREPRLGRWAFDSKAHNGILIHTLNEPDGSAVDEHEYAPEDQNDSEEEEQEEDSDDESISEPSEEEEEASVEDTVAA